MSTKHYFIVRLYKERKDYIMGFYNRFRIKSKFRKLKKRRDELLLEYDYTKNESLVDIIESTECEMLLLIEDRFECKVEEIDPFIVMNLMKRE